MLQWMHDPDAVAHLQGRFREKTLEDCLDFIAASQQTEDDLHLAIVNNADVYLGTVSLKHIDRQEGDAEFAIAIHPDAMGTGCAAQAMKQILEKGLTELGLRRIFWCVSPENRRAVRFYEKGGYPPIEAQNVKAERYYTLKQISQLRWYCVQDAQGVKRV